MDTGIIPGINQGADAAGYIGGSAAQVELAETAGPSTALASLRSGRDDNISLKKYPRQKKRFSLGSYEGVTLKGVLEKTGIVFGSQSF
jgi:hypothetical protein